MDPSTGTRTIGRYTTPDQRSRFNEILSDSLFSIKKDEDPLSSYDPMFLQYLSSLVEAYSIHLSQPHAYTHHATHHTCSARHFSTRTVSTSGGGGFHCLPGNTVQHTIHGPPYVGLLSVSECSRKPLTSPARPEAVMWARGTSIIGRHDFKPGVDTWRTAPNFHFHAYVVLTRPSQQHILSATSNNHALRPSTAGMSGHCI